MSQATFEALLELLACLIVAAALMWLGAALSGGSLWQFDPSGPPVSEARGSR